MAKPAFMRGKGAAMFADKGDAPKEEKSEGAAVHLDALKSLATSPRAAAALKTLRIELLGDGGSSSKPKSSSSSDTKSEALKRFAA